MLISFHILYGWFPATRVELNSCDRDDMSPKAWNIYHLALHRKSAHLCFKMNGSEDNDYESRSVILQRYFIRISFFSG